MAEKERIQAPFNMALSTLESIRKWIDKITELSVGFVAGEKIDLNEIIVLKYRMVKQLIVLTTPLLDCKEDGDLDEIQAFFSKIKIERGKVKTHNGWLHNMPIYTSGIDYELDECVMGIERALQESGHFMPGPDESALF